MIYYKLFLSAFIAVYIVDVSGFTESWRSLLARTLHVKALRPLPPFDCGVCASWWTCIIYAICAGEFSVYTVAFSAVLSALSFPMGQVIIFIREILIWLINKILPQ